jgi:hypothetical protein
MTHSFPLRFACLLFDFDRWASQVKRFGVLSSATRRGSPSQPTAKAFATPGSHATVLTTATELFRLLLDANSAVFDLSSVTLQTDGARRLGHSELLFDHLAVARAACGGTFDFHDQFVPVLRFVIL